MSEDDLDRVAAMRMQAFNVPMEAARTIPVGEMRVLASDGCPRAALRLRWVGQLFGGASVPSVSVASVMVAGDQRGRGFGGGIMREALVEMRSSGAALSVLYPSTLPTYRNAGYELAGVRTIYRAPVVAAPPGDGGLVKEWTDDDLDAVDACYRIFASGHNGPLDRPRPWWTEHVLASAKDPLYRYLVRSGEHVTGYIAYVQRKVDRQPPYYHELVCRDLVWTDAVSARALLAHVAGDRALGVDITWPGPVGDPLSTFFREQDVRHDWSWQWMLRLLDVPAALNGRGYNPSIDVSVELEVHDPLFADNAAAWRLEVSGGVGKVSRCEGGATRTDVATLAAMYTGWLPSREAVRTGRLEGADPHTVAALEAIFGGSVPWMPDMF